MFKIHISENNMKLDVPNISIVPIKDCGNCEYCKDKCYALKSYRQWPNVRRAWDDNSRAFHQDPEKACKIVSAKLKNTMPPYFRIHVAGDFLNQRHLNAWFNTCESNRETCFLTYTKMFNLDYSYVPNNMSLVFSLWPGLEDTAPLEFPRAYMNDGTDTRIPSNAIHCPGKCDDCKACWNLKLLKKDVVFERH